MNIDFDILINAKCNDEFVINEKYNWQFLDNYIFTNWEKDSNSPSFSRYSDGNVFINGEKYIAKIFLQKHEDLKSISGVLYTKQKNEDNWKSMVNMISIIKK